MKVNRTGIPRLTIGSSAEQVGYRDELVSKIFSRMSTRELAKMSTVQKKWHDILIFNRDFALTQYRNCPPDSIYLVHAGLPHQFKFLSHNLQTGNLSTLSFSLQSDVSDSFLNATTFLVAASHGLLCYSYSLTDGTRGYVVYNPVSKVLKILPTPRATPDLTIPFPRLVGICSPENSGKLVVVGNCPHLGEDIITLVFDSHRNSWYQGPSPQKNYMATNSNTGHPLYLNGVLYFIVKTPLTVDDKEEDEELLFANERGLYYKIIGYDVNEDKWCFSIFLPKSVGFPYCLIEWEGKLLVLAATAVHDRNQPVSAGSNINNEGGGRFVIWTLDIGKQNWTPERDLHLPGEFGDIWLVAASSGVLWFAKELNSVIVYHMKQRQWISHQYDGHSFTTPNFVSHVAFEPTFLSF